MLDSIGSSGIGDVQVFTTENRGHSAEEMADMALNKIMLVSEDAPPVIREQALAYKDRLKDILIFYMNRMAQSERTTIWALMKKQGHADIAEIIRRLYWLLEHLLFVAVLKNKHWLECTFGPRTVEEIRVLFLLTRLR